ncbi:CYTOCHROME P450 FAMILY PROTEIN EXPRESSED [Salix purpurea]|uniref:CYTOCHROME P450 FAMILY PROTEIN EXPRESSED n=1 Tax=Salix purpurea TaxID=77065 RepID=A0A9Q0QEV8_SALPP|nr:CYTOCHROME P450 FAMILY PROTEIN EXPRESSED [Salix purpurea]
MKSILASLSFIIFCSVVVVITHQTPWPVALLLLSLSSFPAFSLNYWLVPGGFAWRNHHDNQNPSKLRGPIGWPVLGTLPQMGSLAHRKLASMAASFGATKLMAFSLGSTRVIISSHPDTAREILCGSSFADRPIKESARLLMFERAIGFAPSGEYWRHLRRIAANHMFSPRKISALEPLRQRLANEMLAEVREEMEERRVVVLRGILQRGSLGNVLESVFGSDVCVEREELGFMVKEGFDLIAKFNLDDYFPLRKEKKMETRGVESDFLSALLSLPEEDQLNESDTVALLWEMIFRGTDTVALLLEWIMARMVLHPEIQAKAQQELDTCIGSQLRGVQDSDIPNLPYLRAVVKEVLRLHPPGPLLSWARLAIHDVHVDKTLIPAGTTAMVNMWAITHDPSIWRDPWAFNPDRFIEEDVLIMGSDLRLAPFGAGRRVCPGKALGLATVHLWLARLLHEYKWLPAKPVDLSECLRLSLEMKRPLECHVVQRRSTEATDFDQKM